MDENQDSQKIEMDGVEHFVKKLALEGYRVPDTTQALARTRLAKTYSDQTYDVYTLTFTTAWVEHPNKEGETVQASPSITVRLKIPD